MSTFTLGKFTVREQLRFDNPAWPQYLIFVGGALIGKSFSRPDLGCCEWLERQETDRLIYARAADSAKLREHSLRGIVKLRHARRLALELEAESV